MSFDEDDSEIEGLTDLTSSPPPSDRPPNPHPPATLSSPPSDRPPQPNPFATSFTRELPQQAIDRPLPNFAAPPASNAFSSIKCPNGYCRPTKKHYAWGINKTKQRRPSCKPPCKQFYNNHNDRDNPPPAVTVGNANGGKRKRRKRSMKQTIKNKYYEKSKSNSRSIGRKTRKTRKTKRTRKIRKM